MENIFDQQVVEQVVQRIQQLQPQTPAQWGKMNVAQMLAHCNVSYELVYDNIHPRSGPFKKFLLKLFVKKATVSEKTYKPNMPTGPMFIIKGEKNFEQEKNRLIAYIRRTYEKGAAYFDGKESHSFGKLSLQEWNNMFYKHLDHHLKQFGV
jgi:hypothetical protein